MSASIDYIKEEHNKAIIRLAYLSRSLKDVPSGSSGGAKKWYERLDKFLTWLETEVQMTPELRDCSVIVDALQTIYAKQTYHFPATYADRARALNERWESEGWVSGGALRDEVVEMDDAATGDGAGLGRRNASSSRKDSPVGGVKPGSVKLPPKDHWIWGGNGIMHGVAMKIGEQRRMNIVLDPRYKHEARNAKVYGHNGIAVGSWCPRQLVALFHGAHGHLQSGISGDQHTGAFSIVVTGQYDDLDTDCGEFLYYSGSNSHDNDDPREPAPSSIGTKALHASLRSRQPVRVLRGSSGKSKHAPFKGLRYDGLYTVVYVRRPTNGKGGLYEQFKLERMEGQDEMDKSRPNADDLRHEEQINNVKTSGWETLLVE